MVRAGAVGPDEFETRASVFISQSADDITHALLQELLALRSPTFAEARMAVELASWAQGLGAEGVQDTGSLTARLSTAMRAHGLHKSEEWFGPREWRMVRRPLVECVLNQVLGMREMLNEERGDALRMIVAARSRERIERRLVSLSSDPLREPNDEWHAQLNDWQILLKPYPWHRVRSQIMSRVLAFAQLQEPLTQHVRLVRSYEFLRCLGAGLLNAEASSAQQLATLTEHGERLGCWGEGEVDETVLKAYVRDVVGLENGSVQGDVESSKDAVAQLGFTPRAVRGSRQAGTMLAHLVRRLLVQVYAELRDFCESRGLRKTIQACDSLLELAREIIEQPPSAPENAKQAERLREFLSVLAEDFIKRTPATGPTKAVNFELLAAGDPRMEALHTLQEQTEARRLLDDMALNELTELTKLVHEAVDMVHGPGHLDPALESWSMRLGEEPGVLHPAEIGKLSAALQQFLQHNHRACRLGAEDALLLCVARALGTVGQLQPREGGAAGGGVRHADGGVPGASSTGAVGLSSSSNTCLAVAETLGGGAARRVVACFGSKVAVAAAGGGASGGKAVPRRSPVVVRAVPLGLADSAVGEDYEVRELGVRIGGMYRTLGRDKIDGSTDGDGSTGMGDRNVAVVHYEWVPPGEVREDSKPLEQILASATHVRITVPEGEGGGGTEEREVDLQTNRVHGDSAWYRAIPSRPRISADENGGFRRFVLEVGRGLRLPLPNGLLQAGRGAGVIETADVLASVLALWFSQRHAKEDMAAAFRQKPALLYFASTALFECFDHLAQSFMEALQNHWASVLGMQVELGPGEPPPGVVRREAQEILLELLTARPEGRLCAVLPTAHLNEFCALSERTRHATEFLALERFCFESALEKIRKYQDSTVTFIIVDVTGQLSSLQLGELVRAACGAIRLVFNWYHGLLPSLAVTRSLDQVIVPPSLESDVSTQVTPTAYREGFAVGQATLCCTRIMAEHPDSLSPLAGVEVRKGGPAVPRLIGTLPPKAKLLDWMRNLSEAREYLASAHAWRESEAEWRKSVPLDALPQAHEALLLVVTADEALVRAHYDGLPEGASVQCFSLHHSDRQALTQIEALLDRTAAPRAEGIARDVPTDGRTIIVLFGVGFVSPSKLEHIVARAYLGGQRVVLVVREPVAALRSVRVTTRHATQYVQGKVLWVRSVPEATAHLGCGSTGLRALRLVLGFDSILSEKFAAIRTALESEDMVACIDLLQPYLKSEIAEDLVAGVLQTLTDSSKAVPCDPRSLAFAVGCLAASFAHRTWEFGLDELVWDLSFQDFRAFVPICRFLDQASVLEAWCRYLDLAGATLEASSVSPLSEECPFIWPHREPEQHFLLSHWTLVSNAHSSGIDDMLEHAVPKDASETGVMPPAVYYGTGPGSHSEAHEEILERHSLQRRELDWAPFSESWRTALDIKPDLFLRLAAHGVDTLRLFLCLPPERAIELGLTHLLDAAGQGGTPQAELVALVARRLLRDVECAGPLLEAVVREGAREVAARLAAVKWLLLTVLPEREALAMLSGVGRIDEATVEELVRAKVMLCPRGRGELLHRVVAIIVGLDGGDVLGTQHEIRHFLLETKTPLSALLRGSRAKVGRAIVSFLFSPDQTEQLKRREAGRAVVEGFERLFGYDVLRWRTLEDEEAALAAEPHRVTAAAHAAVLERAPDPEVGRALARGPLLSAVSHLATSEGAQVADAFLCGVLDILPASSDTLVLRVLETLASKDPPASRVIALLQGTEPGKGPLRSAKNKFLPELFAALRAENLGNYLSMVAGHAEGDVGRPLHLALDGCPSLQAMYVQYFRKTATGASDACTPDSVGLAIHNSILDDASCAAMFEYLASHGSEEQPSDMFILWYCWSRSPDRQLPFWALPRAQGNAFTLALNGGDVPFVDRCLPIGAGLSVLAKFLVSPEALPLGVYNTLAGHAPWVHSDQGSAIEVKTVLLGQEDCEEYPPYSLRWHARVIPAPLREKLVRKCRDDVNKIKDATQHDFYPRVASGMSEQAFRLNLGMLQTLTQDNDDLQLYFDHGAESQRQFLAACIICWFKAAGIEFADLLSCVSSQEREHFMNLWRDLHASFRKVGPMSLRKMYVRGPLPSDIDVRWVDEGAADVAIFARTRDSALLTAQWLNMLVMHFGLQDPAPFTPEDLVRSPGPMGGGLLPGPRLEGALELISLATGRALRRDLAADTKGAKHLVVPLSTGKFDTLNLVTRIAVLTDFIAMLRSTPGSVEKFFSALVAALAAEDGSCPSDQHFAALFDTFFSLHGLTPENQAVEIEHLAHAYHTNELPLGSSTLEEIRWLHENYYGRRDKATGKVAPRLPRFAQVCERLTRIRNLPLKAVPFGRHFASSTFVGELVGDEHDRSAALSTPYLQQRHFQLMCVRSSKDWAASATNQTQEDVGGAGMSDSAFAMGSAPDDEFFVATGEDGGLVRGSGGGTHRQWDWPEATEVAWQDSCPVISAPEIVEVDASESLYLHAVLRVRPGLQPILWCPDKAESFYRLNGLLGQRGHSAADICKAFETNADAWQYIDRAQSAVVMCEGFYLRKGDDGTSWLVVFPAARPPDDPPLCVGELSLRHRRHCIWPLIHSHKLVNLGFTQEALSVLRLLVWISWNTSANDGTDAAYEQWQSVPPGGIASKIAQPLRHLSLLSNYVERSIAAHVLPEGDENLVKSVRHLHRYQQCERQLAEVLLRIMTKMKAQQRDDLGELIRSESQRRSATMRVPFVESEGQDLSSLGRALQRLLVPIVSKAGIAGSPITTKSWTQLELVLESCYRGERLAQERCFAKHMHITKSNFAGRGVTILRGLYQSHIESHRVPTVQQFSDSEDEASPPKISEKAHYGAACDEAGASPELPGRTQYFTARCDHSYVDTLMDRDSLGGTTLFEQQDGYGRPLNSRHTVLTFYDEDLPLYFVALNRERLKIQYSASEGMCLGYLLHKNVFAELLQDARLSDSDRAKGENSLTLVRTLRARLLAWIADVLRSPLPNETKTWMLRCCERMGMVAVAPYQEANHVNLAVIAYCLCRCCPSSTDAALFLRNVLMNAWHIPAGIRVFTERKADIYGLYVVKRGTLQKMRELGLHVAVRDFEREVWQRSMNNSAMYLDIISHFSSYCCFTYVQGLPKVDDILLKWLAEYTRLHPWRFIFLENVDTSFNFPENRDRCNFRFAPPNPLYAVKTVEDLRSTSIAEVRPSHTIPYPERLQPMPEDVQDPKRLFGFCAKNFAPDTGPNVFASPPANSLLSADFREDLERVLFGADPCLVLLVSAPGAGKTHHMGALRGRLEGEMQFDIHEFDGSSDILVTTALAEVLQRTITTQSSQGSQKLLILDEYHMLSDEHKDELFEWVRAKLGPTLRVVLIANRIDSKDRQRLEESRPLSSDGPSVKVALIQTRLSRDFVQTVMVARGNSDKWRDAICDWMVGSRLVFGEESVSLRLCDTLDELLRRPDPRLALIDLLLHRIPTISRITATEFVAAYLQHISLRSQGALPASGLVGLCFRVAMLDRSKDQCCSFVEFLEHTPRVHESLPAVRLMAWCVYMISARGAWDINLSSAWCKRRTFVDQVNFPFELGEESAGSPCGLGPTFSWAGDPTSLRDLVDAVKRGHSVDWVDVHRKVWSVEHIKDSELFAQLLSSSRNPGMILQQVLPGNLCSLLRLSNTPAATAVQLALIILRHAPQTCNGSVDRPRCLALWTTLLHDRTAKNADDILRLVGGPAPLLETMIWARDWATDRRATVNPAARTRLLQQVLVLVCMQVQVAVTPPQLAHLWTGSFGRLLRGPTLAQEEAWEEKAAGFGASGMSAEFLARDGLPAALPLEKLRQVIRQVADVQEDWAPEVQALWRTGHNRVTAKEVSSLWNAAPHLLQDLDAPRAATAPGAEKCGAPVHDDFVRGVVAATGTLCRSLQRALLCNNCTVPEGVSPMTYVGACADALNEMRNAEQLNMICVRGDAGEAVHRIVCEEMRN